MNRKKLTTAAVVGTAGFALAVLPASAELRTLTVTLLGGTQITVTVDVPPGTPLDQITIPNIQTPIVGISEAPQQAQPTPAPEQTQAPEQQQAPSGEAPQAGDKPAAEGGKQASDDQETVKKAKSDSADEDVIEVLQGEVEADAKKTVDAANPGRNTDGTPNLDNPTYSLALPGSAPIGVPNFFIEKFRIPPFLLPIYQAAGIEYGIRWEVLAAINEIETDYGRNLNVSSAGALGWMQFMPATWKSYGVDANKDGVRDPYNPVDAIFAAARYLRAAGAEQDLRGAIFAYNHADWYVDSVVMRARLIGGLPSNFVGSLTGLTQGRFPVHAKATYADDLSEREMTKRTKKGQNAAYLVQSDKRRRGIRVYSRRGAPVVAVNDGRILRVGQSKRLGRFVQLQDVYGNTYTYGNLAKVAKTFPAAKTRNVSKSAIAREMKLPRKDAKPTTAASDTTKQSARTVRRAPTREVKEATASRTAVSTVKERLFANPARPKATKAGGEQQLLEQGAKVDGYTSFRGYLSRVFGLKRDEVQLKALKPGARIVAGTILGRIGKTDENVAPHMLFEIRPAGRGAPRIDPKPILDGWKLLESTAIYRAAGKNPFFGPDAKQPSIGQILLMNKDALQRRVLANPRVEVYGCGRRDVRTAQIDRRVLATLEFLAASGFKPTVTSLKCGHGFYTKGGNVSHHSTGNAVDIAKINGIPILGHQGKGSITEMAVQRLLTLQGLLKPDQIITLMTFKDADNTFAMGDHHDHIHVGWRPLYGTNKKAAKQVNAMLKPKQWIKLIDRLGELDNPTVRLEPSKYALKVTKRASRAHRGE
jgi:murein DD-endopeptidase MepM/ murein hydrolase activator NlpD